MRLCTLQKGLMIWKSCDTASGEVGVLVSLYNFAEAAGMMCIVGCVLCFLHVDCQGVGNSPQDSADRLRASVISAVEVMSSLRRL